MVHVRNTGCAGVDVRRKVTFQVQRPPLPLTPTLTLTPTPTPTLTPAPQLHPDPNPDPAFAHPQALTPAPQTRPVRVSPLQVKQPHGRAAAAAVADDVPELD